MFKFFIFIVFVLVLSCLFLFRHSLFLDKKTLNTSTIDPDPFVLFVPISITSDDTTIISMGDGYFDAHELSSETLLAIKKIIIETLKKEENRLAQENKHNRKITPGDYVAQYIGYYLNGKKFLYVGLYRYSESNKRYDPYNEFVTYRVSDGGYSYIDFEINLEDFSVERFAPHGQA